MTKRMDEASKEIQALPVYPGKPGVIRTEKGYQFTVSVPDGGEKAGKGNPFVRRKEDGEFGFCLRDRHFP